MAGPATSMPIDPDRPDPEDVPFAGTVFAGLRACEVLGALMFATVLPWWQPLVWWMLVASTGSWRSWYVHTQRFKKQDAAQRRQIYRQSVWLMMLCVGSAWYFLYLPGNMVMQMVLGVYLLGSAALVALRTGGDFVRATVAVCLVLLPTSLRFLVDGFSGNLLALLSGAGGLMFALTLSSMSRLQERALAYQYELRQRAELAVDAVAGVSLSKSRFFAAVSHDLRQPVHAIGLYLDPLITLADQAQDPVAQRAAQGIRQSWRALDDLLSQVLDLTRMDSGSLQAQTELVELAPLVRDCVVQHSAAAEREGIRIVALVGTGRFAVADALMLKRVLSNLLDNALKFSPSNRCVVIALRPAVGHWRLQVRDAGLGIAPEAQIKIFEEFVQLNNEERDRRRGLGLGLAISKRFVTLMGGTIGVRSALGQGCCMTVTLVQAHAGNGHLPLYQPHASQGFLAQGQTPPPAWGTDSGPSSLPFEPSLPAPLGGPWLAQDVLLVEDDHLVSAAMCQLLELWGMQVRHVETAADALRASAFGQIAVCDVRLPGGASGLDVAVQLRALGKKVLLMTGETDMAVRTAAANQGILLLVKPVSSAKLKAALASL